MERRRDQKQIIIVQALDIIACATIYSARGLRGWPPQIFVQVSPHPNALATSSDGNLSGMVNANTEKKSMEARDTVHRLWHLSSSIWGSSSMSFSIFISLR